MRQDRNTVLVTGGTGFLGSRVVRALVRHNHLVRVLASDVPAGGVGLPPACEVRIADIRDEVKVREAVQGVRRVCHLAAVVAAWSPDPKFAYSVNVEGTHTLADACANEGVERFVHVSSLSAIELAGTGVRDETGIVPRTRHMTDYAISKLAAERVVDSAGRRGLPWVIVYPTRVYGTGGLGDANAATRILSLRLRGRFPFLPGGGRTWANWAFADDVAEGIALAVLSGKPRERYFLGGENATLGQFFGIAEQISGVAPVTISFPHGVGRVVASVEQFRSAVMHDRPRVTLQWYNAVFEDTRITCRKAEQELGYVITPLGDALKKVVAWLTCLHRT